MKAKPRTPAPPPDTPPRAPNRKERPLPSGDVLAPDPARYAFVMDVQKHAILSAAQPLHQWLGHTGEWSSSGGDPWAPHVHPEDLRLWREQIQGWRHAQPGDTVVRELRLKTASGGWQRVTCRERLVRVSAEGVPLESAGALTSVLDETETAQWSGADAAYRVAFQASPTGMALLDVEGVLVEINEALRSTLRVPAGTLPHLLDLNLPDERMHHTELHQKLVEGSLASYTVERRLRFGEATGAIWCRLRVDALPRSTPGIVGLVTVENITGLKLAEIANEQWAHLLRATFDLSPSGIVILDRNLRVLHANPQMASMLAVQSVGDLTGASLSAYVHPDQRGPLETFVRRASRGTPPLRMTTRLNSQGVDRLSARVALTALHEQGDEPRILVLADDITERVWAEEALQQALRKVEELKRKAEEENRFFREEVQVGRRDTEIIGDSPAMQRTLALVRQVAPTDATVILQGETGTGKELLAESIHNLSSRRDHALIKVNCAALPAGLIESELFGHEKGAFTGADARKLGRFEVAEGGTIFLDEIGELPLELQSKLLRVLQEGEFDRVGGTSVIPVDVRVIAATNRNLAQAIAAGRFRTDLYYRLNVFPIAVPPLRERREDIPDLVHRFLRLANRRLGKHIVQVADPLMRQLQAYSWPGNVRELMNVIERAAISCQGDTLSQIELHAIGPQETPVATSRASRRAATRQQLLDALREADGVIEGRYGAAAMLGIAPSTFRSRMKRHGVQREDS